MKKENKAITLIALVITIIILLILAGVTIIALNGDNGILTKSKNAKEDYDKNAAQEALNVELAGILANNNGQKNLNDLDGINVDGYTTNITSTGRIITLTKNGQTYSFIVDENYNITSLDVEIVNENQSTTTEKESDKVNEFNIEITETKATKITINSTSTVSTNDGSSIITYLIYLNNQVIDSSKTLPYTIGNLEMSTEYSGIYVEAIDNLGNKKKSTNELSETTLDIPPSVKLVPTTYVCSSIWDGYPASKAFDGNVTGLYYWHAKDGTKPQYCGGGFAGNVKITSFMLYCRYQSTLIVLQGSNDGTNWTDIQSFSCTQMNALYGVTANYGKYKYYSIKTTTGSNYVAYYEIVFYGYEV